MLGGHAGPVGQRLHQRQLVLGEGARCQPVVYAQDADDAIADAQRDLDQRLHQEPRLHFDRAALERRLVQQRLSGLEDLADQRVVDAQPLQGGMLSPVLAGAGPATGPRFGQVDVGLFAIREERRSFDDAGQDGVQIAQADDRPSNLGQRADFIRPALELLAQRVEAARQDLRVGLGRAKFGQVEDGLDQVFGPVGLEQHVSDVGGGTGRGCAGRNGPGRWLGSVAGVAAAQPGQRVAA
jgi:hypothetical protein